MQLRYLVGLARDELQDLRRTLDAMPGAVAVLHGDGSVLCSNAAAERLFAAGDGVRVEAKKLSTVRAREAQKLAATIRATAVLAEGVLDPAESPRVVHIRRDRARPLGVVFAPLWASNALRLGDPRARVLAAFHDPDAALTLDPALIAELHGFTEVEALLASALVRGLTLAEFAHERSCSEHTVRTHLKRVLEKSGARRQSDLVRVLLGSSALHLGSSR
jgi:DNA-binding CsgD family transcriptional regulator